MQTVTILIDYRNYKAATKETSGLTYAVVPGIACPGAPDAAADPKDAMPGIVRYATDVPSATMAIRTGNALIGLTNAVQRSFGDYLRSSTDLSSYAPTGSVMADTLERMLRLYASENTEDDPMANVTAITALALAMAYPDTRLSENGIDHGEPFRGQGEQEILNDIRLHLADSTPGDASAAGLERFASAVATSAGQRAGAITETIRRLRGR